MSIEYSMKKQLEKIIDNAFWDLEEDKKKKYTWFKIKILDTCPKTFSGTYSLKDYTISIYDISNKESNNIATLLHEVAHHIDCCNTKGGNGHKKEFYDIYQKLIYSALDLKKINLDDFKDYEHRNTDYNKVKKILEQYVYNNPKINIPDNLYTIKVYYAFDYKDKLFKSGYHWNKITKTWDKEDINNDSLESEKQIIFDFGINETMIEVVSSNLLLLQKKNPKYQKKPNYIGYVHILGYTYDIKDELKKHGCFWDKDLKVWKKGIKEENEIIEFEKIIKDLNQKLKTDYIENKN